MKYLVLLVLMASGCECAEVTFRTIHEKYTAKLTNWILADNEASKYKDEEDAARAYLRELRLMTDIYNISEKMRKDGFHWHAEVVDFTSYPWVTIARKRGDCDDWMVLWEAVLKGKGPTWRVIVSNKSGSAHAMLFYYNASVGKLYLLSNLEVFKEGYFTDWEAMVIAFYGENTGHYVKIRSD